MVSIIIPYDKDRGYLSMCLESIRAQTVPCDIVEVHSPESVAKNFNRGVKWAKGEFIKVVGEDDWLPPDSIENLLNGIGDAPWVVGNATQVQGAKQWVYKPETLDFSEQVKLNRIHNGGTMYRTEVIREIGGMDESLWTGEEYEMHLRMYANGYLPKYVDKEVYYHRLWNGQKSRVYRRKDPEKRAKEIARIQALYSDKV